LVIPTGLASHIARALAGLGIAASALSCAPSLQHQQPARPKAKQKFYAFTTEGRDSAALWKRHADADVLKDYDALELSLVNADEALLQKLQAQGELEFYLPAKTENPQEHSYATFDDALNDGTKANKGAGPDWYWQRIHGDAFIKNGIEGEGVVLVVLDTGIGNPDHELIKGRLEKWYDWTRYKAVPYDDTVSPFSSLSHGLACAGEVTRSLPKVQVHMHKIHRPPRGENLLEDILEAYDQIYKDKAKDTRPYVLNQSYGLETLGEFQGLGWKEADRIFAEAEERLWKSSDQIYFTAAAGNDAAFPRENGRPTKYPAQSERVLSAGAYDKDNEIAYFSSLGGTVWAPGHGVQRASPAGDKETTSASGTSFAGPLVAADVVGILSYCHKHGIPVARADVYTWVPEWTDRETGVITVITGRDKGGNPIHKSAQVPMRQVDFENTLQGLEELRKSYKK
jgi:hypothetical protein